MSNQKERDVGTAAADLIVHLIQQEGDDRLVGHALAFAMQVDDATLVGLVAVASNSLAVAIATHDEVLAAKARDLLKAIAS